MNTTNTILIAGLGDVGLGLLSRLATRSDLHLIGARRSEKGKRDCRLMEMTARTLGNDPTIDFVSIDLSDTETLTETLVEHSPDVVVQCATRLPYWRIQQLPDHVSTPLTDIGLGWTAPMNLHYAINLARALEQAGLENSTFYINASTPDFVNIVLDRLNLPCDCGIGNIGGGRIPMLQAGAAQRLNTDRDAITVYAAFPHVVAKNIRHTKSTDGVPYWLAVYENGTDRTEEVDPDNALASTGWPEIPEISHPVRGYPLAVASATRVITDHLHNTGEIIHLPGPNGLPGGWPCTVDATGVTPFIPTGTTKTTLTNVNLQGLRHEGIARVKQDGTIVYTNDSVETVADTIGYECAELPPEDIADRATDIETCLKNTN